jgi:uncharacterized protein YceK
MLLTAGGGLATDAELPVEGLRSAEIISRRPVIPRVFMRAGRVLIAVSLALGLSGCGTVFNFGAGTCAYREYPLPYGGVGIDVEHFAFQDFPLGLLVALADFPFSLVADTVTLPWSIYATATHPSREQEQEPAGGRSPGRDP